MVIIDESALTDAVNNWHPDKYEIQETQNLEKWKSNINYDSDNFSTACRATKVTEQFNKQPIQNYNGNKPCYNREQLHFLVRHT
jgi:hypothetical protein